MFDAFHILLNVYSSVGKLNLKWNLHLKRFLEEICVCDEIIEDLDKIANEI